MGGHWKVHLFVEDLKDVQIMNLQANVLVVVQVKDLVEVQRTYLLADLEVAHVEVLVVDREVGQVKTFVKVQAEALVVVHEVVVHEVAVHV